MKKIFLFLILLSKFCFAQWSVSSAERNALIAIYNSTDGAHWSQQWDFDADPRFWYGIKIKNGSVSEIDLRGNNLKGSFPDVSTFSKLQVLDFSSNNLSGEISSSISTLINLKRFDVSKNNLSGNPATILASLPQLTELSLGENGFLVADINAFLQNFPSLQVLDISKFSLTAIPQKIATFSNLKSLNISDNAFASGFENLSNLTNLEELYLSNTNLNKIPSEISTLVNLKILDASSNAASNFATLTSLNNLEWLSLADNKIATIPAEISSLNKLVHLNLNHNTIASGFSPIVGLTKLEQLFLNYNKIDGSFPSELLNIGSLQMISLNGNNISSEIPENVPSVTLVENNRFTLAQIKNYLALKNPIAEIDYTPQRYDTPITINASLGSTATLPQSLSFAGNYQFNWYKNLDSNLFSGSESYQINPVQETDYTNYTCEAYYVNDFTDYILEASFFREPITLAKETLATSEVEKGFFIFPNPTSDYLNIRAKNIKVNISYIYDLSGKLVKTEKGQKINVASFPSGTYLIIIDTDSGIQKFKFIKK